MHTGFDVLESSKALRGHWARRFLAALIDIALLFIPVYLIVAQLNITDQSKIILMGILAGLAYFLYSAILEYIYGRTVGKLIVHLKVVSMKERRTLRQTLIRSVPKLFWFILLPFDVVIGLATEGDPRKRWTDGIAKTLVISYYPAIPRGKRVPKASPRMQNKSENEVGGLVR